MSLLLGGLQGSGQASLAARGRHRSNCVGGGHAQHARWPWSGHAVVPCPAAGLQLSTTLDRDTTCAASTSHAWHHSVRTHSRVANGTTNSLWLSRGNTGSVPGAVATPTASVGSTNVALLSEPEDEEQAHAAGLESKPDSGRAGDKELVLEIKACDTWQDVLEIVTDEADRISVYSATQAVSQMLAVLKRAKTSAVYRTKVLAEINASPAFLSLTSTLVKNVPTMSSVQLSNSLHGLAQLHVPLKAAALDAYAKRTQVMAPLLNARDVAQLLHGWATLRHSPGPEALDMIGFCTTRLLKAGEFQMGQGQALSMVLHSLAQLDYNNRMLLNVAAMEAAQGMKTFTPQAVANISWSLAKLGHYSHATLAGAVAMYSRNPAAFKLQETANLLWALTQQRYHPGDALGLMVRSFTSNARSMKPVDFAMLFTALGTFMVHPGNQQLTELLQAMQSQLPKFGPVELCNVYWGLALIGESQQPVCAHIARSLPDLYEANKLDQGLMRQTFQALLCHKLDLRMDSDQSDTKPSTSPSFPPLMLKALERAWSSGLAGPSVAAGAEQQGQQDHDASSNGNSSSVGAVDEDVSAQGLPGVAAAGKAKAKRRTSKQRDASIKEEVTNILKRLRVPHEAGRLTADKLVRIDMVLKPNNTRYVALQVVMEHEHTCNTGQFLGPLQFQTRVLELNGWEVKHILAKDLKSLDEKVKPLFLADLLRGLGLQVSGGNAASAAGMGRTRADLWVREDPRSTSNSSNGLDLLMQDTPGGGRGRGGGRGGAGRGGGRSGRGGR